ncbi:MAG: hypothetical protein FWE35_23125 [Streptosporangiales bacterium]|nr:hypothetical protein [Streptosporangiales bacterium]
MTSSGTTVGPYAALLPLLITILWCLTWLRPPRQRWALLAIAPGVSILVTVIGFLMPMPAPGQPPGCSSTFACNPAFGTFWVPVGIYGIGWSLVLLLLAAAIDLVQLILRARSRT